MVVEVLQPERVEAGRYRLVKPDRGIALIRECLEELGEDVSRPGLVQTPSRVWDSLLSLTDGYYMQPEDVVGDAIFEETYDEAVVVEGIEFYSLCEHHMLPFFGQVHIGYLPAGRIVGLSKLPRLVDLFSHRLQVQERLTEQIAEALDQVLSPRGVGVVIEASHMCLQMRGVEKQGSRTVTSAMRGMFKTDSETRAEFLYRVTGH